MKNKKQYWYCVAMAATMTAFSACSNEEVIMEEHSPVETPAVKGHPLMITAGIGGQNARLASEEVTGGIKLSWEVADKLYMLTSKDGTTWEETFFTFAAQTVDETDATKATFVCKDFTFPEGTTNVKFIYTTANVSSAADLGKNAQTLGTQNGTIADVAKNVYLETSSLDATTEEAVKNLTATLSHANAVMKVVVQKSDIEWGEDFAPQTLTLKLESSTAKLEGTTENTITLNNSASWDETAATVTANVVVCMTGTIGENDRWIFSTTDKLGNPLVKATTNAKQLVGGKRYNAPVRFTTEHYFPMLSDYIKDFAGVGSFDEATKTLITGQYGARGWEFTTPLNLSLYKYLVLETEEGYGKGTQLRLYCAGGFWDGTQSQTNVEKALTTIDLTTLPVGTDNAGTFTETGTFVNTSLNLACFWSFGGEDHKLVIKKMYLTNTPPEEEEPQEPEGEGNTGITIPGIDDSGEDAYE